MKRCRIFIVIIIFSLLIGAFSLYRHTFNSISQMLYPLTTTVYHISPYNDVVTVIDYNGNLWQFSGIEDWQVGDICSCIMQNNNTEKIQDDTIITVKYDGHIGCGE